MQCAFGVEMGVVSKAAPAEAATKAAKVVKVGFKPIKPKTATGPGSQRSKMSMSAWETQTAAAGRGS